MEKSLKKKMKKALIIVLILSNICFSFSGIYANTTMEFNDQGFYEVMLNKLNYYIISQDNSTRTIEFGNGFDANNIKALYMENSNLTDITDISKFPALERLFIINAPITDISPILSLTNLRDLEFGNNNITDISNLGTLTSLQHLELDGNNITDYSTLSNLSNLNWLALRDCNITGGTNQLVSLSSLTNLKHLAIGNNQIEDISSLSGLVSLEELYAENNKISNVESLENLNNLKEVYMNNNEVIDITSFAKMSGLQELYLENNQVENITAFANSTELNKLQLSNNNISKIEDVFAPTANLNSLGSLNLNYNKLTNLDNYTELLQAQNAKDYLSVSVYGNNISDLSGIENLDRRANTLYLGNQQLTILTNTLTNIPLPDYISESMTPGSVYYIGETPTETNCKISADYKTLDIDPGYTTASIQLGDTYTNPGLSRANITIVTDLIAPTLSSGRTPNTDTNGKVNITITADEKIQPVTGWILSQDQLSLTKEYSENLTEDVIVKDIANNESTIKIVVDNIIENQSNNNNNNNTDSEGTNNSVTNNDVSKNPETGDKIMTYMMAAIVSSSILMYTIIKKRKIGLNKK